MSLKKKFKTGAKKIIKGGKKTVGTVAAVAFAPVVFAAAVKKSKDD